MVDVYLTYVPIELVLTQPDPLRFYLYRIYLKE